MAATVEKSCAHISSHEKMGAGRSGWFLFVSRFFKYLNVPNSSPEFHRKNKIVIY